MKTLCDIMLKRSKFFRDDFDIPFQYSNLIWSFMREIKLPVYSEFEIWWGIKTAIINQVGKEIIDFL